MLRTSLITALCVAAAAAVAWRLGGRAGAGALAGFVLGAGASGLGVLWARHALVHRPERALQALLAAFVAKLGLLLGGALAFRYVEAAGARVDWKGYVVAFAAAAAIVLPLGAWDAIGEARRRMRGADPEHIPQ